MGLINVIRKELKKSRISQQKIDLINIFSEIDKIKTDLSDIDKRVKNVEEKVKDK